MKSVCFTGHRSVKLTDELENRLTETLESLISDGVADFYAGGAYGFDMICELTVIKLREHYPQIKLHLILPCSAEEQTAKWSESLKKQYYDILAKADSTEYVSVHYDSECMRKRNRCLVELADVCVCYYNKSDKRSGTAMTVRFAEEKKISIYNLIS